MKPAPWSPAALFATRPTLARLVGNAGWLALERIAPMATAFVVNALFVRYLGPARFGLYSYATSFSVLFASVASLGMDAVVVRELTRAPDDEGEILGTALVMRLGAALLLWAGAIAAVVSLRNDPLTRLLVAILAAQTIATALNVFECHFQARIAARPMVLARTAVTLLAQVGRVLLVLTGASLPTFALLSAAAMLLSSALLWLLFARTTRRRLRFAPERARQLVRDAWPMLIVGVSIMVYVKVDQLMLTAMAGERENGIYATAVMLSELPYFLPLAVAGTAFPLIVKAHDGDDPRRFEEKLQLFYDAMVALGYAIALPVLMFAGPIVQLLYGSAYAESATVLRIHVVSLVFVCVGVARGQYLIARNETRFSMIASLLAAALNVVLNLALIPRHGALGAAWSTLLSYAAAGWASGILARRLWRQTGMLSRSLLVPLRPALLWRELSPWR
jgi:PST family polysaccharide transporter